jgi:hypothetical protein
MVQMIKINHQTLRGIIPLTPITNDALKSTFQPLMITLLLSLLKYCPLVSHAYLIEPDSDYDRSRWTKFQETNMMLQNHNNSRLGTLEYIEVRSRSGTLTDASSRCLLQLNQSNGMLLLTFLTFPLLFDFMISMFG